MASIKHMEKLIDSKVVLKIALKIADKKKQMKY